MKQIKKIRLAKMVLEGFKGFEERFEIMFDKENEIVGHNSKGKSSLFDAIIWTFTGSNRDGKVKDIDIVNNNKDKARVIITFYDQDEEIHEITRSLRRDSSSRIKLDLEPISVQDQV